MNETAPQEPEESPGEAALSWIKSGIVGFLIFIIVRTFLVQTFTIVSGSMEGTLLVGDFLVLNKSAYGAQVPGTDARLPGYAEPTRGDIIVFRRHPDQVDIVKRLVGMPGDTLAMRRGTLYRNGAAQDEPYTRHGNPGGDFGDRRMSWQAEHIIGDVDWRTYRPTLDDWGPLVVPDGRYFVLGDNRHASLDSRYWGFVEGSQIQGRAIGLYFSYSRRRLSRVPVLGHIRWDRVLHRLQ